MIGERVALGAAAGESADRRRPGGRLFRRQFASPGFELFKFERQLVDQPRRALRPLPVDLALELGDPELLRGDQRDVFEVFARATARFAATSNRLARSAISAAFRAATSSGRASEAGSMKPREL